MKKETLGKIESIFGTLESKGLRNKGIEESRYESLLNEEGITKVTFEKYVNVKRFHKEVNVSVAEVVRIANSFLGKGTDSTYSNREPFIYKSPDEILELQEFVLVGDIKQD